MKWLISLVLFVVSTSAFAQESLKPVPSTGKAYTVLINDASLNGNTLSIGDTVAVIDGGLSVGASEFQGELPLVISAWEGDASQNLDGFTAGNPMTFKVKSAIYDSVIVYEPGVTYEEGDGTFGYGAFTSAILSYQTDFSPNISINTTSLDFESVRRGSQATKEFAISNTGNAQLQIYSVNSNDSQISVDYTSGKIPAGASQTVTVTYSPTAENPLDATLNINSSDPDNAVTTVDISGQGLPALAPVLSMEPNSYLLGNIKLQEAMEVNARVYNRGNDTLRISSVTSSNSNTLTVDMNDLEIPSGEFSEISFTVQSTSVGQNTANIQFQSNGTNGSATSVPVSWVGYEGFFSAPVETGLPYTVVVNRISIDNQLPSVGSEIALMDGETVVGHGVYTGSFPLSITAWQEDTQQGLSGFSPGDSISAMISTFKYNQQLEIDPDIEFERGDGTYGDDAFSVIGTKGITGLAPTLEIDESPLIYGDLSPNYTDTLRKWIYNVGDQDLNINSTSTTGNFSVVGVGSYSLAGGDSTYVDIEFRANSVGINEGVFTLETNDPFNSNIAISLRGRTLIEVPEERVSLSDSESPWLHSPLNSASEVSLMFENNFARTEEIDLSIENSNDVSLQQNSVTITGNESKRVDLNLNGSVVGADTLQLVLTYQDGHRQEIELYQLTYENHFEEVVETGLAYSLILNLNEPGKPYTYGDQIAVYDGGQIVGLHIWKGSNSNIPVTAWKANQSNGLPGYSDGNEILFKVYKNVNGREGATQLETFSSTFNGDGTFGSGAFQEATIEVDEPIYFNDPSKTVFFRENQFSATTYASLDTLVKDPNGQFITHTFNSDTTALVASKFANFYRLQLQQDYYGEVNISHRAETETSLAHDTTTFFIMDIPEFQSAESHDLFVGDSTSLALFNVQIDRDLTHSVEILNEGYANLNVVGDSLSVEVLKEGVFYVDVNVTDNYGFDITKRISFTARYNKPWISTQMDTLRFNTTYISRSDVSTIVLNHTLPVDRNYAVAFENGDVFSADVSEVSLTDNGTSEIEVTFSPNSEDIFSDTLYLIYSGFETDTSFALPITATGLTLPDPSASVSTNSLSFGDVEPGRDNTESVMLTNTGVIDIQMDSVVTSTMAFGVDFQSTVLKPDSSMSLATSFSPDQIGEYSDSLRVYVKDMEAMVVSLDGRGAAAIAELGVSAQDFGTVRLGETSEKSFWLYNKGNLALSVDALLLEGEVFSARLSADQITAYDSLAVTTSFSPADVVSYSQDLQVVVDSGSDTLSVSLNGTGYADPRASISTDSLSFGDVKPGSDKTESVTLINTGVIDIQVDSVVTSTMAFGVDLQSTILNPDSSMSIATTFSPDQIGGFNDSLRVYIRDLEAMVVSLDGRGAAAIAELGVSAQNFGNVKVGETSEKSFWLYNKGNLALSLDALLLEGEVFSARLSADQITAYDSLAVTTSFSPADVVSYSQDLQLIVDSGSDTLSVALIGTGFTDPPPEPGIAFSTYSLSFGDTFLTEQKTDTLIIRNNGGVDLSIDSVKVSTAEFNYNFQPFVLKPDSSSNLLISFQPSQIGFHGDTLQVFINELGMSEIPLTGSGVGAIAELSERSYDFGEVSVGESSDVDVWLFNRGNIPLAIDTLILDSEVFSVEMLNSEVAAQDSVKLMARFSPLNAESYEDELMLKTNASADTLLVTMKGLGTSPVSIDVDGQLPIQYSLKQNYPNPFNPSTTIKYSLPEAENVNLQVFDLLGRRVASLISKHQSAGVHTVNFDASQLATGIYIYRIVAGDFVQTKKLMLVK